MLRVALTVALLAIWAAPGARAGADEYFSDKSKDFGPTPRGPVLVHYFYIKNTSQQTLNFGQARVSCGCTAANVLQYSLAPGETTAVMAQMDTRRIPRSYQPWVVTIFVPVYGPQPEEVHLTVQAIAREDLQFSNSSFAFGTVKKGTGATATTKVTFQSDPNWKVTSVTSTGTHVKAEAKLASRNGNDVTYEVTATLDPDCPVGNWTAEVFLHTNNSSIEKIRIPVTVNIPAPIVVTTEAAKDSVKVGEEAIREIVLKSADPFKVLGVKGSDNNVILQTSATDAKEAKVHRLSVKFSADKPGSLTRTFEITTSLKAQPKVEVEFKATAVK
ncbi:MAG TPA: DUF1573 domain-containing protein [Fimbriiglobus sp.]|jgi:hypothetical protein